MTSLPQASYFQRADVALPGVQKFFAAAALEEREHAQMLIDYINERGGNNQFEQISVIHLYLINSLFIRDVRFLVIQNVLKSDLKNSRICPNFGQKNYSVLCRVQ